MKIVYLFCAAVAFAQPQTVFPDTVVLTVHGRQFTRAEFESIALEQKADAKEVVARLSTASGLARAQTLADEARKRKLDQLPTVRAKLEIYTAALLKAALFDDLVKEIHQDESIARKYHETHQHLAEERHLRQILIRHMESKPTAGKLTPAQALQKAQDLRAKITAGAKFSDLAMANSDDEATKSKGGDMNFVRKPLLVPEFGTAAFQLQEGEVSQPVKTSYGYHLILLEKIAPPEFSLVQKSIEYEIGRQRLDAMVVSGIQMNPDYFGK